MSADVIELPGHRAPAKVAAAEPDLNDPRFWLEPAVAPAFCSNLRPRITVAGGFATIMFAMIEHSLPHGTGHAEPGAIVQAKIVIPAAMLQDYAIALAQAAGAQIVEQAEGSDQ